MTAWAFEHPWMTLFIAFSALESLSWWAKALIAGWSR